MSQHRDTASPRLIALSWARSTDSVIAAERGTQSRNLLFFVSCDAETEGVDAALTPGPRAPATTERLGMTEVAEPAARRAFRPTT